jgi:hypothetical protein
MPFNGSPVSSGLYVTPSPKQNLQLDATAMGLPGGAGLVLTFDEAFTGGGGAPSGGGFQIISATNGTLLESYGGGSLGFPNIGAFNGVWFGANNAGLFIFSPSAGGFQILNNSSGAYLHFDASGDSLWINGGGNETSVALSGTTMIFQTNGSQAMAIDAGQVVNFNQIPILPGAFTGTLAAAIAGGKNVSNGIILA